jgi:hypothetical protein
VAFPWLCTTALREAIELRNGTARAIMLEERAEVAAVEARDRGGPGRPWGPWRQDVLAASPRLET